MAEDLIIATSRSIFIMLLIHPIHIQATVKIKSQSKSKKI